MAGKKRIGITALVIIQNNVEEIPKYQVYKSVTDENRKKFLSSHLTSKFMTKIQHSTTNLVLPLTSHL